MRCNEMLMLMKTKFACPENTLAKQACSVQRCSILQPTRTVGIGWVLRGEQPHRDAGRAMTRPDAAKCLCRNLCKHVILYQSEDDIPLYNLDENLYFAAQKSSSSRSIWTT